MSAKAQLVQVQDKIAALVSECEAIGKNLETRDLTAQERQTFDAKIKEVEALRGDESRLSALASQQQSEQARKAGILTAMASCHGGNGGTGRGWSDRNGNPVRCFARGESMAHAYRGENDSQGSIGDIVRAMASGNSRFLPRNSMSEAVNGSGGYLVPQRLSAEVLDKARAASAVLAAGALIVPMDSDNLTLCRVESDPSFTSHNENETIAESDVSFKAITFQTRTIATLVRMSRELAEDAPNVTDLILNVLAKSLAAEIDQQAVSGTGSGEGAGLTVIAGIGETGSIGGIEWADIHNAVTNVRANNYSPNAYVVHPTIGGDLDLITATGSGNWLGAPPSLQGVERFTTTNISTGYAIAGDFTQCAFGVRSGTLLEVTTTGHDAFSKHSVLVKATWRGCFRVLQEDAFYRLAGITT